MRGSKPVTREVKLHQKRGNEAESPLDRKLTCPIALQLRRKAEKELIRNLAKIANFRVKDQVPKNFINQKNTSVLQRYERYRKRMLDRGTSVQGWQEEDW